MSRVNINGTTLQVDDTDSGIIYSGDWSLVFGADSDYNGTKHTASGAGASATFKFSGTGIEVWGPVGSISFDGQPVTTYSVDGGVQSVYATTFIEDGTFLPSVQYFVSPPLADGDHTLVITNRNGTAPSTYNLDFLRFTPSVSSNTGGSSVGGSGITVGPTIVGSTTIVDGRTVISGVPSSAGSITTMDATAVVPSAANTAGAASTSVSANSHSTPVGAIVGGAIGGIVLVLIIGFIAFLWTRKRRARNGPIEQDYSHKSDIFLSEVDPFIEPMSLPPRSKTALAMIDSRSTTPLSSLAFTQGDAMPTSPVESTPGAPQTSVSTSGSSARRDKLPLAQPLPVLVPTPEARQHVDSGVRIPVHRVAPLVEIPPAYSQD